ncbi:MAG: hypothetical protein M1830_009979 [Pleopsidium flavum]|nr:MAG: hypothetical protein M1830_009979 [Pleopsidium flavum]
MATTTSNTMVQLPSELRFFTVLESKPPSMGPRLGSIALKGRIPMQTPHYIALSSRGAVPHVSQDIMRKHTRITGVYVALEDFIEKAPREVPPIYNIPPSRTNSPLRQFIALQQDALLVLGPRRSPPVPCPASNTHIAISILTSVGFRRLESEDYVDAARELRPDIVVGMGDLVLGKRSGLKRVEKMGDRTTAWTQEMIAGIRDKENASVNAPRPLVFAPILPVEQEQQSMYLNQLQDEMKDNVHGLALYDAESFSVIPNSLLDLPRLSFDEPSSPQEVLRNISLGMDILTIPFVDAATDAGISLDFFFPCCSESQQEAPVSLGLDMWSSQHASDLSPLRSGCQCYTCSKHHRAYIQHLLTAKEMLGWVLLQIHNHQVLDEFFAGIRRSIRSGTYAEDKEMFEKLYERRLPEKTGQGPRVRGYQFKSSGSGESKKNALAYKTLDETAENLADASLPSPSVEASDLEERGFGEKA